MATFAILHGLRGPGEEHPPVLFWCNIAARIFHTEDTKDEGVLMRDDGVGTPKYRTLLCLGEDAKINPEKDWADHAVELAKRLGGGEKVELVPALKIVEDALFQQCFVKLMEISKENAALHDKIKELNTRVDKLERKNATLHERVDTLERENAALRKERAQQEAKWQRERAQQEARWQRERVQQEAEWQRERAEWQRERAEMKAIIESVRAEVAALSASSWWTNLW